MILWFVSEPITLQDTLSVVIGIENGTAIIQCNASGNPRPSFTWEPAAGGRSKVVEYAGQTSILGLTASSNYVISPVQREDARSYTCTVANTLSTARAEFSLVVHCELIAATITNHWMGNIGFASRTHVYCCAVNCIVASFTC